MKLRLGQFSLKSLFEYWYAHWLAGSNVTDGQVGHGKVRNVHIHFLHAPRVLLFLCVLLFESFNFGKEPVERTVEIVI